MVESRLDVILDFIKKGTGAQTASKDLGKLEKSTKGASKETKGFNIAQAAAKLGLAAVTVQLLRQLPQMANLGFKYKNAQIALEAYAGSAEEATAITEAISEASGFAIDKFGAVTNATRLLSLGLASNAEEAAEFTRVAVTLGATMGKDVQGAFEEFSLLLANQSILRLDTYGISGAKVREEMARLAAEFPELDRSARFTNATMTIAREKMDKLEEAGFEATSSIDRLGAEFENLKLEAATLVSNALLPVIDSVHETTDSHKEAADAIFVVTDSYEDYKDMLQEVGIVGGFFTESTVSLTEAQFNAAKSAEELTEQERLLAEAEEKVILTTGGINELLLEQENLSKALSLAMGGSLAKATDKWDESLISVDAALIDAIEEQGELNQQLKLGKITTEEHAKKTGELQIEYTKLETKSFDLRNALEETTKELIFQAAAAELDAETSLLLARELGLVDEATFAVAQESQRLRIQYDNNALSAIEFATEAGNLALRVGELQNKNIAITVDTVQAHSAISNFSRSLAFLSSTDLSGIRGAGFQEGGQFTIPDNGQRGDSVPVSFMAEPGETVTVTPNDGGSPSNVSITNNISSDVDIAFFQQILEELV